MSEPTRRPDEDAMDEGLARSLESVPAPPVRAAFRTELREQFVAGAEAAASAPVVPSGPLVLVPRRSRAKFVLGLVAAAALIVLTYVTRRATRVELLDTPWEAVLVDGVAVHSPAELAQLVRTGARFETGDVPVRLRLDGVTVIELAERTRVVLRGWEPGESGATDLELARGGLRVATGPRFAPRRLRVFAPDATVEIVGTEFGVDVIAGKGTCVCCTRGEIAVTPRGRASADQVVEGGSSFCFASDAPPELSPAKLEHAAPIVALRRYW